MKIKINVENHPFKKKTSSISVNVGVICSIDLWEKDLYVKRGHYPDSEPTKLYSFSLMLCA